MFLTFSQYSTAEKTPSRVFMVNSRCCCNPLSGLFDIWMNLNILQIDNKSHNVYISVKKRNEFHKFLYYRTYDETLNAFPYHFCYTWFIQFILFVIYLMSWLLAGYLAIALSVLIVIAVVRAKGDLFCKCPINHVHNDYGIRVQYCVLISRKRGSMLKQT